MPSSVYGNIPSLIDHSNTASQIFDAIIFPILSYNIEVWGIYTKQDFKTWNRSLIEKIHLQFCKRYLEVNNKASIKLAEMSLEDYHK